MRTIAATVWPFIALVSATASVSAAAQQPATASAAAGIADSLFLPITLPATLSFGYPPNTIHKPQIVEMIRGRDFDGLDAMFDALEADVRRDVKNEIRFSDAFDAVDRDDPPLLANIDAWIAAKPRSAHARVARANYHFATAWRRRGRRYIRDTPPENIRAMREYAERAVDDVVAALQLDSTHLEAYTIAMRAPDGREPRYGASAHAPRALAASGEL
jgi:hypothetical protein